MRGWIEAIGSRGWGSGALVAQLAAEQARWFLWLPVAFGAGIAIYFQLAVEPPLLAALLPVAAAGLLFYLCRQGVIPVLISTLLLTASAGLAIAKLRTEMLRAPVLDQQMRNVEVVGWIELIEPKAKGGQRFTILPRRLGRLPPARMPHRLRVTTKTAVRGLQPGYGIALRATVGPPGRPALPGGYDFARHAWFQGIGGVGFSRDLPRRVDGLGTPPIGLRITAAIQSFRQAIGQRVDKVLPGETGAIAKALITGERGGISDDTNDQFRDSGLFHILSISGLHMAIMAGSIFFVIRLILAAIPSIALRYPIKKWGALGAALGALAYLTISGGTFATVRSYVMISIMFLAILLDRPALALRNVALAALVILVLFPESLFNVGFQMSFSAVAALVSVYEALSDRRRARARGQVDADFGGLRQAGLFFAGIILTTLIASAAVAPFAAYHFHKSQQFAVLANLIAVPICNVIVMPAALATFIAMPFGLEAGPLWIMGQGIDGMIWCARSVAALPGAVAFLPQMPVAAFGLMLSGGLWLTLWRQRWRLLGALPIIAGLLLAPFHRPPDILAGGDGELIALRGAHSGQLDVLPTRGNRYELSRWLEADGDARDVEKAMSIKALNCDSLGCAKRLKGVLVALPRHQAALGEDCRKATIIITNLTVPRWCGAGRLGRKALLIIDRRAMRDRGTHAIRIFGGAIELETVAGRRGLRPWTKPAQAKQVANKGRRLGWGNGGARQASARKAR